MSCVLKGFSSTIEHSYSRGFYKNWIQKSWRSSFSSLHIFGAGKVYVNRKVVNKAGTPVSDKAFVEIIAKIPKYVCRAGYKLEAAIEQLGVNVAGKIALDSGLRTADKIRRDEHVCVIERTNLRYLSGLPQKVDLVTLDLSFISVLLVMPGVVNAMKEEATLVTLVKPQFEARRSQGIYVGSGGVVRDPKVHEEVLGKIIKGVENFGFQSKGWIESPLKGAEEPLSGFRLSYQRNGKVYLLTDNEDVERFIAYISVSCDDVTLYVVEPRSSEVGSVAGSNQLSFSTPVYGAQNLMVPPQFHHQANIVSPHFQYQTQSQNPQPFPNPNPNQLSAPNSGFRIDQLDDDEPTEKIMSTSQYSKFDLGQYPDFDLGQYSDFDDFSEEETDHMCNDFDIGQYPNFDDETAVAEEDVVDDNKEEVTTVNEHVEHPFCNSYNPEEEKEEEEISKEKSPKKMPREYNCNMPELLQIPEEELVKIAVDCYTKIIRIKKDDCFDTKEDLKIALYTKCVEDGYQLKVNKSSKDRFETRVYRGHEIMTDMNARFKISISYSRAWRAKWYALELLRGSPEASFAQLPAYCHNLKLKNPGSVTHIKTDRDGRFELLFIAIDVAIRSFITCMRPVIIVDGAHLKGRYLGGLLGPISNLTIISDRANSIDNAVRRCFPYAFHRLCGVHLYRNLKSRSAGIKNHKWTYWKAVKAYREVDFNKHINCLRRVLPQCAQTLEDVGFERWSRVHQLGARYGFMTSNSAESINALSRHSRKLPITMLMEFFRASIQQWYYKKRNHADDSSAYAMDCYTTEVYRQTYVEIVYPIPYPSEWDIPDDLQTVLPPAMDRRLPGRPKSHDRIPFKGEEKKRSTCSWCKESGHTRLTYGSPVPSQSSFPLPKYGSSSKSQSQPASPFGTVNLGDF
ncbi:Detected protein of confused Function [Hibiscus syriacus]|uniref:Detected protein of confused Function n=1 Tax=Hibiscus syriacus TaxID=106335 RepID=A0A6A2XL72_HIBSY|nr:Detected protein of confused Function [Hibiscus syriacus]